MQNISEHLLIEHLADDSFLGLSVLSSFSENLFYRAPLENCSFHAQVAEFQPADILKIYFIGAFEAFYKTFEHSFEVDHSLKIPKNYMKELIHMKLRDANLQVYEKSSFTHLPSCILLSLHLHFLHFSCNRKITKTAFFLLSLCVLIYTFS